MLATRLKSLREKMKMTQGEISKRLGMARTTYSGYENGARDPDPDTLKKIADFHEVSIDYLVGRETTNDQAKNDVVNKFSEKYARLPHYKKKLVDDIVLELLGEREDKD